MKYSILILQCLCTISLNTVIVTSGRLWQLKRDEIEDVDLTVDDNHIPNSSSSFK